MVAPLTPTRLRDLANVEEYVRSSIDRTAPTCGERRDVLQARGVSAVMCLERALPPGVPLVPILDEVLPSRLLVLHRGLSDFDTVAAAA